MLVFAGISNVGTKLSVTIVVSAVSKSSSKVTASVLLVNLGLTKTLAPFGINGLSDYSSISSI
jgi:hypothetical protein